MNIFISSMEAYNLDTPLMKLSSPQNGASHWTVRNAVEGVQIFGGIGSGKTTGSGRMLALKYLAAGFGGLVLTVKPDEKELWQDYCKKTGRTNDLLIVEPGGKNYFNFLDYESSQSDGGSSITENIVQVLKTVIRASEEKAKGATDDTFWETALDMLIFNIIDLCKLAYGKISVQLMYDLVQTLPKRDGKENTTEENVTAFTTAYAIAERKAKALIEEWTSRQSVETLKTFTDEFVYNDAICNAIPEARVFKFVHQFFQESFLNLAEKTRSIIDFSFSGFLFRLLRDPVYTLFCNHASTFTPEDCLSGKIIILNLPVKIYHKIGQDCQIMFKYIWQRAMEKRRINAHSKPLFLWADEAQNFLHEHDADYQATARSSRIATVYISQNLPNYHANMGGAKSDYKVKSFLGTLATKIFHANADIETNRYASELIGDGYFEDVSKTATAAGQFSSSKTRTLKIDKVVRPEEFANLKTGGPENNFNVEAYLHLQGNPFRMDINHLKVQFNQHFIPHNKNHAV